MPHKICEH